MPFPLSGGPALGWAETRSIIAGLEATYSAMTDKMDKTITMGHDAGSSCRGIQSRVRNGNGRHRIHPMTTSDRWVVCG
jgi:hypothetical protein